MALYFKKMHTYDTENGYIVLFKTCAGKNEVSYLSCEMAGKRAEYAQMQAIVSNKTNRVECIWYENIPSHHQIN